MSAAERRALILLLSLGLVGQGVRWWLTRPDQAPGEVQLLAALPPRSPAAHRDSILALARPLGPDERIDADRAIGRRSWPGSPGSVSRWPRESWRIARPGGRSGARRGWTGCPAWAPGSWPPSARTLPSPALVTGAATPVDNPNPARRSGRSSGAPEPVDLNLADAAVAGRPAGDRPRPGPGHRASTGRPTARSVLCKNCLGCPESVRPPWLDCRAACG